MYRGRVEFTLPILWTLAFLVTFTIGGMTGVLLAIPGADFLLHNSLFLVAHFHNVLIGGALFGYFAGIYYWFPKAFGFTLNERLGKYSFWCWVIGFYLAFMPLYMLGFMGMTRRLNHYDNPAWTPYLQVALVGAVFILAGIGFMILQIIVSIRDRKKNLDLTGDPWNARTLEWSTSSPAPFYNFAVVPRVDKIDAFHEAKKRGVSAKPTTYAPIHMPRSTGVPFVINVFILLLCFALIWHIWWLVGASFVATIVTVIRRSYDDDTDYYVSAAEVERIENARRSHLTQGA
jgi:cytochrome o ubiquinol oxidase subunit 1